MKNSTKIILAALVIFAAFLWFRNQSNPNVVKNEPTEKVQEARVRDLSIKEQGYGYNVIVEVENLTSKEIKFCEVTFTWRSKEGNLIDSAIGMGKNINSNSIGIVDRYFDGIPEGATCEATITDITF